MPEGLHGAGATAPEAIDGTVVDSGTAVGYVHSVRWTIFLGMLAMGSCNRSAPAIDPEPVPPGAGPPAFPQPDPPALVIRPRGNPPVAVHVEVARTEPTREHGLMFRQNMAEDHGMIFVFAHPEHQTFWMHNTILPLDMVFIREDRTILGVVKNATPETDAPREVPGDSLYVLELNGGYADRHHIAAGDRIDMIGIPAALE